MEWNLTYVSVSQDSQLGQQKWTLSPNDGDSMPGKGASKEGRRERKRKNERTSRAPFLRKERWTDLYVLASYACWTSEEKIHHQDGHGN